MKQLSNKGGEQEYQCGTCGHKLKTADLSSIRCPKCGYKGLELATPPLEPKDGQPDIYELLADLCGRLANDGIDKLNIPRGWSLISGKALQSFVEKQVRVGRISEVKRIPTGRYIGKRHAVEASSSAGWGVTEGNNTLVARLRKYRKDRLTQLESEELSE